MSDFKKITGIIIVMVCFAFTAFAAGNRARIDSFLKNFEELVIATEKAADSNKLSDFLKLEEKALVLEQEIEEIEDFEEWTTADAMKYLDLTTRYANAAAKISNSALDSMDSLDLSAYGL